MTGEEDTVWEHYKLAIDGVSLPPDLQLRGPIKDPKPTCPVIRSASGTDNSISSTLGAPIACLSARRLGYQLRTSRAAARARPDWFWNCFTRFRDTKNRCVELHMVPMSYVASRACSWLMAECRPPAECLGHRTSLHPPGPGIWPGESGRSQSRTGGDALLIDGRVGQRRGCRTGNIIWPADPPVPRPGGTKHATPAPCGIYDRSCRANSALSLQWRRRYRSARFAGRRSPSARLPRWRPNIFFAGDPGSGRYRNSSRCCACLLSAAQLHNRHDRGRAATANDQSRPPVPRR